MLKVKIILVGQECSGEGGVELCDFSYSRSADIITRNTLVLPLKHFSKTLDETQHHTLIARPVVLQPILGGLWVTATWKLQGILGHYLEAAKHSGMRCGPVPDKVGDDNH